MDEIEQQIAALQEKKNQLKISDTQDKLNNFCKNISEIPLSDIKTTIESKIKQELYNNCIKQQYGYWEKLDKINYLTNLDVYHSPNNIFDDKLPAELIYNLLDKSIIDRYNNKYEIKLYVNHSIGFHGCLKNINVDNFDFIVNNGNIETYLLLFKNLEVINSNCNGTSYSYAIYIYNFPENYYNDDNNIMIQRNFHKKG